MLSELKGIEGKRKVRTVLSRYFLKEKHNPNGKIIEDTMIRKFSRNKRFDDLRPLLLFNLLVRSAILRIISDIIYQLYPPKRRINYSFLRKRIIEKFGEKDISTRSLRNFLSTLVDFQVLKHENNFYTWNNLLEISEVNFCHILKLYSFEYLESPQIVLDNLHPYMFMYFHLPDVVKIVEKYNNVLWQFQKQFSQNQIIFYEDFPNNFQAKK